MGGLTDVTSKLLPLVSKAAPLLGNVLGTPFIGIGLSLLAKVFGVDAHDIEALTHAISSDPEADVKLKTLQNQHIEMLGKLANREYSLEVKDRMNARKNSVLYKDFLRHMAYFVTCGFFGSVVILFLPLVLKPESRDLLSMLIGMLASKWQTIIDFFYGSSRQNQIKV